ALLRAGRARDSARAARAPDLPGRTGDHDERAHAGRGPASSRGLAAGDHLPRPLRGRSSRASPLGRPFLGRRFAGAAGPSRGGGRIHNAGAALPTRADRRRRASGLEWRPRPRTLARLAEPPDALRTRAEPRADRADRRLSRRAVLAQDDHETALRPRNASARRRPEDELGVGRGPGRASCRNRPNVAVGRARAMAAVATQSIQARANAARRRRTPFVDRWTCQARRTVGEGAGRLRCRSPVRVRATWRIGRRRRPTGWPSLARLHTRRVRLERRRHPLLAGARSGPEAVHVVRPPARPRSDAQSAIRPQSLRRPPAHRRDAARRRRPVLRAPAHPRGRTVPPRGRAVRRSARRPPPAGRRWRRAAAWPRRHPAAAVRLVRGLRQRRTTRRRPPRTRRRPAACNARMARDAPHRAHVHGLCPRRRPGRPNRGTGRWPARARHPRNPGVAARRNHPRPAQRGARSKRRPAARPGRPVSPGRWRPGARRRRAGSRRPGPGPSPLSAALERPDTVDAPAEPREGDARAWVVLALIALAALALRVYRLPELPGPIYSDEAYNGVDALAVLAGWHPIFFPANNGREPLHIYLQAISVGLFGPTDFALRIVNALVGTATVVVVGLLGRSLLGWCPGLLGAAFLAISYWHITLSRLSFRVIELPLWTALAAMLAAWA